MNINKINKNDLNQNIRLSDGNFVLKQTNDIGFLIFNLPARISCPYATEWCKKCCYAMSAQDIFKAAVLKHRLTHMEESKKDTFVKDMINIIEFNLNRKKYKSRKIYFRWHESGDIYSKAYFEKMIEISNHFKDVPERISFQAYTKSLPIISQFDLNNVNIKILFSIVEDTKKEDIDFADRLGLSFFSAVDDPELETEGFKCIGDCSKCQSCYEKNNIKLTFVETHGSRVRKNTRGTNSRIEETKNYLERYKNK